MITSTRILNLLHAIALIFLIMLLLAIPDIAPQLIAGVLGLTLIVLGIRSLISYVVTFRHMIRGKLTLYMGVLTLDMGLLIMHVQSNSRLIILIFLLGFRLFSGAINLAQALQSRKIGGQWRFKAVTGILNLGIALVGLLFIRHTETLIYIYSIGLAFSAVEKIIAAFRKPVLITP